ncbi:hypothetical protein BY458DRAFT_305592 [Sporodiniella umbellata]|nr:hypothetical protein BY458DRAFT_305592 [Sporodiniella umbellata]
MANKEEGKQPYSLNLQSSVECFIFRNFIHNIKTIHELRAYIVARHCFIEKYLVCKKKS